MMNYKDVVIVGAGPAGLAAAISLEKDAVVLESQNEVGGLSRSVEIDGAVFDFGGHSFHTPHEHVRNLVFNSLDMYEQKRDARCLAYGSIIPYPFQKNFRLLEDSEVVQECAASLKATNGTAHVSNFEDFIYARFGAGIAKHFMLPYNRKLWGRDLKRLAADWVGERVAAPEGIQEKFDFVDGKRKPLQDDTIVAYPAKGGFGEIFRALAHRVHDIRFGSRVVRILPNRKQAILDNGTVFEWQNLISTLPIQMLLGMIDGVPERLTKLASQLECLSLKVVCVVIGHSVDTEIQRVYSAESHIAAHKTAINHNSSDYLRALPHHGIMAEVAYGPEKPLQRDDLDTWVVENLLEMRLIHSLSDVRTTEVYDVKYAYPVPTVEKDKCMAEIKAWLSEQGIYTLGRFGEWAYINSDEALHRGLVLGHTLRTSSIQQTNMVLAP